MHPRGLRVACGPGLTAVPLTSPHMGPPRPALRALAVAAGVYRACWRYGQTLALQHPQLQAYARNAT